MRQRKTSEQIEFITDSWRGQDTRSTTDNTCTETDLIFVYLYASEIHYNISFAR